MMALIMSTAGATSAATGGTFILGTDINDNATVSVIETGCNRHLALPARR